MGIGGIGNVKSGILVIGRPRTPALAPLKKAKRRNTSPFQCLVVSVSVSVSEKGKSSALPPDETINAHHIEASPPTIINPLWTDPSFSG